MKNRRNILMIMFAVVVIMGIGFAAYSQQLKISDTSSIDSNWDVYIKKAVAGTKSEGATGSAVVEPTTKLHADLKTDLKYPGAYIIYTITVANDGNIDAVLEKIDLKPEKEGTVIKYSYILKDGTETTDNELMRQELEELNVGDIKEFSIKVSYDSTMTGTATDYQKSNSFKLELTYVQKGTSGGIVEPINNVVYSLNTENIKIGDSIDSISTTVDKSTLGKNYYLKYEIDSENKVLAAYLCFVTDSDQCMQAGTNNYQNNIALLKQQKSWFTNNGGNCTGDDLDYSCTGAGFNRVAANDRGNAYVNETATSYCSTSAFGSSCTN